MSSDLCSKGALLPAREQNEEPQRAIQAQPVVIPARAVRPGVEQDPELERRGGAHPDGEFWGGRDEEGKEGVPHNHNS